MRTIKIKKYAIIFTFYIALQLIETLLMWWVEDESLIGLGLMVFIIYPLITLISGVVSYCKTRSLFVPTLLFLISILISLGILFLIEKNTLDWHYIRCAKDTFEYYPLAFFALITTFVGALSAKIILFIKSKKKTEDSSMSSKNN